MASVMGICGGMVGPKSENVEKVLVFKAFFEGSRAPRVRQDREQPSEPDRFEVQKVMFLIKNAFCLYLELCFLQQRGVHFQKNHEKMLPGSEKWSQNYVRYMKIPAAWGRIHEDGVKIMSDISRKSPKEATCSNNTHICKVF